MAELPLSQTVDASRAERSWRSSAFSLTTSALVQGLIIAALIVTPLLVTQAMPEPVSQLTLPPFVPATFEPPVERVERTPTPSRPARPAPKAFRPQLDVDSFIPPPDIPERISDGEPFFDQPDPNGVPGGIPASLLGRASNPEPADEVDPAPQPILVIGDIRPPRKLVHINPIYPPIARGAGVQGTVKLQAIIDADGRVSNLIVLSSVTLLDQAAIDAVRKWRYEPTILNGRAVPVIMTVAVEFTLR